jgi:hypothetical protein
MVPKLHTVVSGLKSQSKYATEWCHNCIYRPWNGITSEGGHIVAPPLQHISRPWRGSQATVGHRVVPLLRIYSIPCSGITSKGGQRVVPPLQHILYLGPGVGSQAREAIEWCHQPTTTATGTTATTTLGPVVGSQAKEAIEWCHHYKSRPWSGITSEGGHRVVPPIQHISRPWSGITSEGGHRVVPPLQIQALEWDHKRRRPQSGATTTAHI